MRRIHEKISHFIQNKRLTKYLNNPWYLAAITSLVLLLSVVICSYRQCWRHVGSAHNDISVALTEYSNAFYSNKYHIWYESFHAYGLLLFLLTPLVMACVYSNQYYDKSDVYQVYRKGFLHYYAAKFGKALSVSAVLSGAAMLLFWTGLCVFAHGTGVYIEDTGFIPEAYVIPSITIVNESVKNTAAASPFQYVLYTFSTFFLGGMSYCMYVYAVQPFLRSKITRLLLPTVAIIIADFVMGMLIPSLEDSLLFDTFNPACLLSTKTIVLFHVGLWAVSLSLLSIHYFNRKAEG